MAHPVWWQKDSYFYPLGNTPAVNLTQDLPPEVDADILLLASGDCRSILYTVHADLQAEAEPRKLDVTCCDYDPAIFARNVLLFSLIIDNALQDKVWEFFYHPMLTDAGLRLLFDQCRKLLELSKSYTAWNESPYSFVKFATDGTREEIRRHWDLYLAHEKSSRAERRSWAQTFSENMEKTKRRVPGWTPGSTPLSSFRSAGPLAHEYLRFDDVLYNDFWRQGRTTGTISNPESASNPNPTFAYSRSGRGYHVHYATQPAQSFHLETIMATGKATTRNIVDYMRSEFSSWCQAFRGRMNLAQPRLVIRVVVGDALAVSHALRICHRTGDPATGIHADAWTGRQLNFVDEDYAPTSQSPAPTTFNIIDTSNIADHLGLINILVVTIPLLRDLPSAVIHTNTLLSDLVVGPQSQFLFNLMCGDAIGIGTLLGVLPLQAISHFTTNYNKHEGLIGLGMSSGILPMHEPISWRRPVLPLPQGTSTPQHSGIFSETGRYTITIADPEHLGDLLFSFFLTMFREESVSAIAQNMLTDPSKGLRQSSLLHYTRESFVCFLALVKERTTMDWNQTMEHLLSKIQDDHTMVMNMNHYQDLLCSLHLRDVYTLPQFSPSAIRFNAPRNPRLRRWTDVPPTMCVIFKVPRRATKVIEEKSTDKIGGPLFECQTAMHQYQNSHGSIQVVFGDFDPPTEHDADASDLVIREDPAGWQGTSPLIVTFHVPTLILVQFPDDLRISLNLRPTPYIMMALKDLAPNYELFSVSALDRRHVQYARHRPRCTREVEFLGTPFLPDQTNVAPDSPAMLVLDPTNTKVQAISVRHVIKKGPARTALLEGATVETKPISDFVLSTSFGDYTHRFNYPCPVKGGLSKMRIARKSHYIQIEVPLRRDYENTADLSMNPFLVVPHPDAVHLLNLHHVNLERCPVIDVSGGVDDRKLEWLPIQLTMMYSDQEEKLAKGPENLQGGLLPLKQSINDIIRSFVRLRGTSTTFVLSHADRPSGAQVNPIAVVIGTALRFDLGSHNIIFDACVIPLLGMKDPTGALYDMLPLVHRTDLVGLVDVQIDKAEAPLWDMFFLATAERCRNWKHGPNCEYRTGDLPCLGETRPFCSCGKGKNVDCLRGTAWAPWASQAYRVAMSPLFPLSRVFEQFKKLAEKAPRWRKGEQGGKQRKAVTNSDSKDSKVGTDGIKDQASVSLASSCARCGGPGKPNLSVCSGCKKAQYCSRGCQVADWKVHKKKCAPAASS